MRTFIKASSLSAALVCLGGTAGWSQIKVTTPECSISFGSGWAMFDSSETALSEDDGTSGIAVIRSLRDAGAVPLDLAEETRAVGDSLEGHLTLSKDETKTIGTYSVRIFTLKYDTLARLERVAQAHGRNVTFRNGTLKAYVIRSQGVRVNIIGVYAIALFTPFAGIEQAIPSLVLSPTSSLQRGDRQAAPAWSVSGGRLRFEGEAPLEVAARDGLGRVARLLRVDGAGGTEWSLPSGSEPLFLTARFSGNRMAPAGWWVGRP